MASDNDDSSSSDDEPMLSSPDPSDDEDEDQKNDVFKFRARKFEMVHEHGSPVVRRRRRTRIDAVQQKLELLEKQAGTKAQHKKAGGALDDDDSSLDEEIYFKPKVAKQAGADQGDVIEVLEDDEPAGKGQAKAATSNNNPVVEFLDSDDSDEEVLPTGPMVLARLNGVISAEVMDTLRQSQMAASKLRAAQHYHAEDVHVEDMPASPVKLPLQTVQARAPIARAQPEKPVKLGRVLRLQCRCQVKINNKVQSTQENTISTHEHLPLSDLMDKVKKAFCLASDARITMSFDGESLDTKRTPISYEIESDDIVDIAVSLIAIPTTKATAGTRITLKLRSKKGKKIEESSMVIGSNEPLRTLMDKYKAKHNINSGKCAFQFDGETLNLTRNAASYEMENGELVDVIR